MRYLERMCDAGSRIDVTVSMVPFAAAYRRRSAPSAGSTSRAKKPLEYE